MDFNIITFSIPLFFLLIGIEMVYTFYKKLGNYRLNDSISNLSQGTGQQLVDIFMKSAIFFGYVYIYEGWRLFEISQEWYVWILLFIGVDFFYYWFHRMSHKVNALWAAHIVHHQSEEYNLTVALRQSWIQGWFSWVFYLPLALIGFQPTMFLVVSALITVYQFWIHTKYIRHLGFLEHILNTPSHHRVHHGSNLQYIDKNHAGTFIIWDKMFGTFQKEEEEVIYGITKPLNSWNPLWANLHYWKELIDQAKAMSNWSDRIKVFYKSPGWRPVDHGDSIQTGAASDKQKYNPQYSALLAPYVIFQFSIGLVMGVILLNFQNQLPIQNIILYTAFTIITLVSCGALLENKVWVKFFEPARLIGGCILIYLGDIAEHYTNYIALLNICWYGYIIIKSKKYETN